MTIHSTVAASSLSSAVIAGSAAMIAVLFSPTANIVRQQAASTSFGLRDILVPAACVAATVAINDKASSSIGNIREEP